MSLPAAGIEIKQVTKHVEATIRVISGPGFNSRRLHSLQQKSPVFSGLFLSHDGDMHWAYQRPKAEKVDVTFSVSVDVTFQFPHHRCLPNRAGEHEGHAPSQAF